MARVFSPEHFPLDIRARMFRAVLSTALRVCASRHPDRLRVYYHQNRVRVLLGRLIVMTAGESGLVWIAVDPETLLGVESELASWRRDTRTTRPETAAGDPYPEYKRPPSINGYYLPLVDPDETEWSTLRRAHHRFLDDAVEFGPAPDLRSKHEPDLLDELAAAVEPGSAPSLESRVLRAKLSTVAERRRRLEGAPKLPTRVPSNGALFDRNPDVVAEALYRAEGRCDLCGVEAPFAKLSDGSPYLEVHHCIPLAAGGEDTIENALAVCPTCHRRLHHGMTLQQAIADARAARRTRYGGDPPGVPVNRPILSVCPTDPP